MSIVINAEKKAAIEARQADQRRDALAEITALKDALVEKAVLTKDEIEGNASALKKS